MASSAEMINELLESLDDTHGKSRRRGAAHQFYADLNTYIEEEFSTTWEKADADQQAEATERMTTLYIILGEHASYYPDLA